MGDRLKERFLQATVNDWKTWPSVRVFTCVIVHVFMSKNELSVVYINSCMCCMRFSVLCVMLAFSSLVRICYMKGINIFEFPPAAES